jgi:hypothetical protein
MINSILEKNDKPNPNSPKKNKENSQKVETGFQKQPIVNEERIEKVTEHSPKQDSVKTYHRMFNVFAI